MHTKQINIEHSVQPVHQPFALSKADFSALHLLYAWMR